MKISSKIFIKRYPSKGELPRSVGGRYNTDLGNLDFWDDDLSWTNFDCVRVTPEYWLQEIELPSEDDVYSEGITSGKTPLDFIKGANFILNKLKGE